jgi:hypothetical protein
MRHYRQTQFAQNQFSEALGEYSSYLNADKTSTITRRNASHSAFGIGATTLTSAGVLILAIWSVTLVSTKLTIARSGLVAQTPVFAQSIADNADNDKPPLQAIVRRGPLSVYHWGSGCPLENARSLRADSNGLSEYSRTAMTRRDADLKGLRPCQYCLEIGYWKSKLNYK